ncbi:hypothetical protein [Ekhidna sp.]
MKKTFLLLLILSLLIISSCGDDAPVPDPSTNEGLSGTLTYNGKSFRMKSGVFASQDDDGDAFAQFFLGDGTVELIEPNTVSFSNNKIEIRMTAVSKGTASLENGDYATTTNDPDLYVNLTVTTIEGFNTDTREALANGTVSISGSGNTYSLTFDVPFEEGVKLTGTVTGTYENP